MAKQYKACENISILHHNNPIHGRKGQRHSTTTTVAASPYILHAEEQQNEEKPKKLEKPSGGTRGKKAK